MGNYHSEIAKLFAELDNRDKRIARLQRRLVDAERERDELLDPIYCTVCGSCGEEGCCAPERCLYNEPSNHPNVKALIDKLEGWEWQYSTCLSDFEEEIAALKPTQENSDE